MMRSKKNDLKFGIAREIEVLDICRKYFKDDSIKNTKEIYNDEYCVYDYEGENGTSYEVKSRRNTKSKYETTLIPVHKIRKTDNKQNFVFNFTDACCYITYDEALFKTFVIGNVYCSRQGDTTKGVPHYHIPVGKLITIVKSNICPTYKDVCPIASTFKWRGGHIVM
tara:strand:+ start:496 stop:996 length:501 start_codon:yes stop_codon:yes gene_type:complete